MRTRDFTVAPASEDARILVVALNRPQQRNAMSQDMVDDLLNLLNEVEAGEVAALVIMGNGKGFCAGSDLAGLAGMTPGQRSSFESASAALAQRMTAYPLPIVAAVHGFAIGGGLTLAAACDIVVTHPAAKWSLPEVPFGLFPAWGLDSVSSRTSRAVARRLSWGLDLLDGSGAASLGLADSVADDPIGASLQLATRLAGLPRRQSAAVKDYFSRDRVAPEADAYANRLFMEACETSEATATFLRYGRAT